MARRQSVSCTEDLGGTSLYTVNRQKVSNPKSTQSEFRQEWLQKRNNCALQDKELQGASKLRSQKQTGA